MTELLGDRAFAVPPLDAGAADALVASLRAAPLLAAIAALLWSTALRSWVPSR